MNINDDVVIIKGAGHKRVRMLDTGVIVAVSNNDARVLIDRTKRHAWIPDQDLRCTRLGGWKAIYDTGRAVCPKCLEINFIGHNHWGNRCDCDSLQKDLRCGWCGNSLPLAEITINKTTAEVEA